MILVTDQESIFSDGQSQRNLRFLYGDRISNDLVKCSTQKCITSRQYVHMHSKEFHVKKRLTLVRTCSRPVSMFPYIYVTISSNFQFTEQTSHTDVWTIANGRLKFNEVWSDRLVPSKSSLHKLS